MTERARRGLLYAGGAAALLLFLAWLARGPERPPSLPGVPSVAPSFASGAIPMSPPQALPPPPVNLPPGATTGAPAGMASAVHAALETPEGMKELLARYLDANRLPPHVIRLTPAMTDVLKPNQFHPTTVPYYSSKQIDAGKPIDPDDAVYGKFVADRFAYLEKEDVEVALSIWEGQKRIKPLGVKVSAVTVEKRLPDGKLVVVGSFSLGEIKAATPDAPRFVGRFSPAAAGLGGYNGYLRFSLTFTPDFMEPQHTELMVLYAGERPATFTGVFTDELRQGSIELRVGVDVKRAGKYTIQGLLYAKGPAGQDDVPVALATWVGPLEIGTPDLPLQYYGLVFHDAKLPGPYVLKAVRGYRQEHGGDGHGPDMPEWTGSYVTKPYALSDLTSAEWTSPQKEATVKAYHAEIARLSAGKK